MKFNLLIVWILGISFLGCGGGGESSNPSSSPTSQIAQEEVSVEETTEVGSVLKKVTIPVDSNDKVLSVTLTGKGAENFQVNSSGEISLKTSLLINKPQFSLEKTVKKKEYSLQLVVKYRIKNDYKVNVLIIILSIVEEETTSSEITSEETISPNIIHLSLSISGTPKSITYIHDTYQFLPKTTHNNVDVLTFSIQNRPSWAVFNTSTGVLTGKPSTLGSYQNIIISVNNGKKTVNLTPFDITVNSEIDIAHKYGKATQGTDSSYGYYSPARYAIDNNDSTYNHTRGGKNGKNWLQIELPNPTKIFKIILQNRSHAQRLSNAKVYVTNTPYTGTVDVNDLVKTLPATTGEVTISLDSAKSGRYVLIKGELDTVNDERHIHLNKLEVYGETPVSPSFDPYQERFLISGAIAVGIKVATVSATDYQGDDLSYSIVGTAPFTIDSNGNIKVNGALISSSYSFEIEVSDGINTTRTTVTFDVTSTNVIADVLVSGDVVTTKVTEEELVQATLDTMESGKNLLFDAKVKIFNLNSDGTAKNDGLSLTDINWRPTWDAATFISTIGDNTMLLESNAVEVNNLTVHKKEMAVIGEKGSGKYLVFGSNPLRNGVNNEMNEVLENSMAWLTKRDDLKTNSFDVVIAHVDESTYFRDETKSREWLDTHYAGVVSYNNRNSCEGTALEGCLATNPDLLIVSQVSASLDDVDAITLTIKNALERGIAVLYVHHDGNLEPLGKALLNMLHVTYEWDNRGPRLMLSSYSPIDKLKVLSDNYKKIKTLFTHFKEKDYDFDWSRCKDSDGVHGENNDNCSEVVGLSSAFQEGSSLVRSILNGLDNAKKNIFLEDGYKVQKLLTLTADKFRQSVSYPMDKATTDDNDFMKSYYADHAIYNYRSINPKQLDMGNFSRSDFSHISPTTRRVQVNSKKWFRSTGAYALPGQTVSVTRNDSSDLTVKVFINTLRSGATHQFQVNGYNRPKYLQTPHFEIKSGETITFTSPYGGPLQLEFSKNDLPVDVTFSNVGEHAYWGSIADNASFAQKLNANEYEWAEIATAGFEVHSKLDKMVQSVSDERWGGTAEGLATAVVKYTSNYPHVLAGFKGEGVDVVPEIHDWATTKGLTIETIDIMKHMNADQATCGYGCSGNPYDAYWAFNPIGHGDIHEMGHSMQKMRFEGFPNHAATNTFSYYTKARYFANTGGEPDCQGLPFKSLFETIQASFSETNTSEYLKANLWDRAGLGEQYLLKIQAMMHAQKLGKLDNGWHVLARVHILEREMRRAKQDWDARKASVGFSTYSLDEINAIGNNDWLTIAYSYASELDLQNYFTMMGIPFSQKAKDQIASFNFEVAPNSLFVSTNEGYCKKDTDGTIFDRPTLPIDGRTAYGY